MFISDNQSNSITQLLLRKRDDGLLATKNKPARNYVYRFHVRCVNTSIMSMAERGGIEAEEAEDWLNLVNLHNKMIFKYC